MLRTVWLWMAILLLTGTAAAQSSNPGAWFDPLKPPAPKTDLPILVDLDERAQPHLGSKAFPAAPESPCWFDPTCPKPTAPEQKFEVRHVSHDTPAAIASQIMRGAPVIAPRLARSRTYRVDTTELRKLAYLPSTPLSLPWDWKLWTNDATAADKVKRIAVLEKELQGNTSDAERYAELAELYDDDDRPQEIVDGAYAKARQLFRKRIKKEPANGWLHAQLAAVLWQNPEAMEAAGRQAVHCSPKDCRCWITLGKILFHRAIQPLLGIEQRTILPSDLSLQQIVGQIAAKQHSASLLKQSDSRLQESLECFDKAVSAAPGEPAAYGWRVFFQYTASSLRGTLCWAQHLPLPDRHQSFQDSHILSDMRHLAFLLPDSPEMLGDLASACLMEAAMIHADKSEPGESVSDMDDTQGPNGYSKEAKKYVDRALAILDLLAESDQPSEAALACRIAAFSFIELEDLGKAEEQAGRAAQLEPSKEENWDLLVYCKQTLDEKDHGRRAYDVCQQKLQHFPSARSQLALARACVPLELFDEAEAALRAGLKDEPGDIPCQLALAATLLLKDDRPGTVIEVRQLLQQLISSFSQQNDRNQKAQLVFLAAICEALYGETDSSFRDFKLLDGYEPKKDLVQKALKLFEKSGPVTMPTIGFDSFDEP
jgi:tetratricopeptide (TPR) repeat protein